MSDEMKVENFTRLTSKGHRIERRRPAAMETLGRLDRAVRSVPPGEPLPQRYNKDLIGELLDERYGKDRTKGIEATTESPEAQRVVVARKVASGGQSGDDGRGGTGPSAVPLTGPLSDEPKPKKKGGFFGFGRR